jgi:hypothetical protein
VSLYQLQKFLYELNREPRVQASFSSDAEQALADYDLDSAERTALLTGDVGLLYVLGVNGQILMHFAAHLGIEWFDYLERMRQGVRDHGPVRAGVYTMTGGGESYTSEGNQAAAEKGDQP